MPTYTFRDTESGEVFERVIRMSDLDAYKEGNPHLEQVIGVPTMISGHNFKPDSNFREVLKRIKKSNPGSNIDTY